MFTARHVKDVPPEKVLSRAKLDVSRTNIDSSGGSGGFRGGETNEKSIVFTGDMGRERSDATDREAMASETRRTIGGGDVIAAMTSVPGRELARIPHNKFFFIFIFYCEYVFASTFPSP